MGLVTPQIRVAADVYPFQGRGLGGVWFGVGTWAFIRLRLQPPTNAPSAARTEPGWIAV